MNISLNPHSNTNNYQLSKLLYEQNDTIDEIELEEILTTNSKITPFIFNSIGIYKSNSLKIEQSKRKYIMNDLSRYFNIEELINDIEFLIKNERICNILPSIKDFIDGNFLNYEKVSLKLLNEGNEWQTIFIYIYTKSSWEEINEFTDKFYDYLFEKFPREEKNINISFVS